MAITGVEIAGIALAVVPLCIMALEHHQDELRMFKSLLGYTKVAQEERIEFGIIYAEFEQVMRAIVEDLTLSPAQFYKLFGSLHKATNATDWSDKELEEIFIVHFGIGIYKNAFTPLLQTIMGDIKDVLEIIGLNFSVNALESATVWNELDKARDDLNIRFSGIRIRSEAKKRAKLALKAGLLRPKREALSTKIRKLSQMRTGAQGLSGTSTSRTTFKWPLTRLRKHAVNLYGAFSEALQLCTSSSSHCINLQMNCRLHLKGGLPGMNEEPSGQQTSFTLAVASDSTARDWHALRVVVDDDPFVVRRAGRVRFAARGMTSCHAVEKCICTTLARSLDVAFSVDSQGRLYEKAAAPNESVIAWSPAEWTSMKSVLEAEHAKAQNDPLAVADLDDVTSTMLALTLASSFLQLCSTNWVADAWNTDGVMFRRLGTAVCYDSAYMTLAFANRSQVDVSQPGQAFDRGLLTLAAMLLEIGTNKPMAQCRKPNDCGERHTIRRCLAEGQLDDEWPGFKQAVSYCLECAKRDDANLPDIQFLLEIAGGVMLPLQRDLESFHMHI